MVGDVALESGPYAHKYRAAQFHFHWGKTSHEGAEHLIDGKAYAAEVSIFSRALWYAKLTLDCRDVFLRLRLAWAAPKRRILSGICLYRLIGYRDLGLLRKDRKTICTVYENVLKITCLRPNMSLHAGYFVHMLTSRHDVCMVWLLVHSIGRFSVCN